MKFKAKKYKWGYSVWVLDHNGFKHQVAKKLKTLKDVNDFIHKVDLEIE